MNKDLKKGSNVKSEISPADGKPMLSVRFWILKIPFFWYLEDRWKKSIEFDYTRSPRDFYKNRIFKKYLINAVYYDGHKYPTKNECIKMFLRDYRHKTLLEDKVSYGFIETDR